MANSRYQQQIPTVDFQFISYMMRAMTHAEKLEKWYALAEAKGIRRYRRPPIDFFLQKIGLKVPPILFWSFPKVVVAMAIYFGGAFGVLSYYLVLRNEPIPVAAIAYVSTLAGLLFGVIMAWSFSRVHKRKNLPPWDQI